MLHVAYFYLLWLAIQLAITEREVLVTQPFQFAATYAHALIEPINTLWDEHDRRGNGANQARDEIEHREHVARGLR